MRIADITSCTESEMQDLELEDYTPATSTCDSTGIATTRTPLWVTGFCAAALFVGTGGSIAAAPTSTVIGEANPAPTGAICSIECIPPSIREEQDDTAPTEVLSLLQHYLSLNLTDLAAVLHVSRPTIYSWMRDESAPQAYNVERIRQLARLTKFWSGLSRKPLGSHLRTPVLNGLSLFDLLSQEQINMWFARKALVSCSVVVEQDGSRPRAKSAVEIAREFGLRAPMTHSQEESVAQETGL